METQWIVGETGPAESVWKDEKTHGDKVGFAMLVVCGIVVCVAIPGSTAAVWLARIIIGLAVPFLVTLVWNAVERRMTHVPEVLIGVDARSLPATPIAVAPTSSDDYSPGTHRLSKLEAVLWTRGTHGAFGWPVFHAGGMEIARFEVSDDRIRITGFNPVDEATTTRVSQHPGLFDQTFPHPTVAADPDRAWIVFDPDGRLPASRTR